VDVDSESCRRLRYRLGVPSETLIILNPASAAGATGRRRREVLHRAESALGWIDLETTESPRDAVRLARKAAERGVQRILVAGGDGTTSEVVSGILESDVAEAHRPAIGLLPLGSGWDLARSVGLPRDLDGALSVIANGTKRRIDAGRVEVCDPQGRAHSRFFVNEASAGLSGVTVQKVGDMAKRIGPRLGFIGGAILAAVGHRPVDAAVEIDGERICDGPVSMVVAANGCYFGAGMRVAPGARLDDGKLEVVIVRGLSVPRLLANMPAFFLGRHGKHPSVSFHAAKVVQVLPNEGSAPVDLDGELSGGLPLRAEILEGAIEVYAPPSGTPGASGQ
jgi:diacylglycerol kinase (ATP)